MAEQALAQTHPMARLLRLNDKWATDSSLTGAKAANIAYAARIGLKVSPGFVLTTKNHATGNTLETNKKYNLPHVEPLLEDRDFHHNLKKAWADLSDQGQLSLVVRSSSTIEDTAASSYAGVFKSVLNVRSWHAFLSAVNTVLASVPSENFLTPDIASTTGHMAVLVQRQLHADIGGIMFSADPVTGRNDRIVIVAGRDIPDDLVGGKANGNEIHLTPKGNVLQQTNKARSPHTETVTLRRRQRRQLARLAGQAEQLYGCPQDIEWAFDAKGTLWLLQSRPITTAQHNLQAKSPLFGPGPVAETFSASLFPLENDLWIPPLRTAMRESLGILGTSSAKKLAASPLVLTLGGRVAVDLDITGIAASRPKWQERLNPVTGIRKIAVSWRVGKLRVALPTLTKDLITRIDTDLADVPNLTDLSEKTLLSLLQRTQTALVALHGHEILAGMLLGPDATGPSAAGTALATLTQQSAAGLDDAAIIAQKPGVLILIPPGIRPSSLPHTPGQRARMNTSHAHTSNRNNGSQAHTAEKQKRENEISQNIPVFFSPVSETATPSADLDFSVKPKARETDTDSLFLFREALRVRVRWTQELGARAAWELGARAVATGGIEKQTDVLLLRLAELDDTVHGKIPHPLLAERVETLSSSPLPTAFRLAEDGTPIPEMDLQSRQSRGAGGGIATGIVVHSPADIPPKTMEKTAGQERENHIVLVVQTLDPELASLLPHLGGLISETGSVLSHLAILARELKIPTIVGIPNARAQYPPGTTVLVNGTTGEANILDATPDSAGIRSGNQAKTPDSNVLDSDTTGEKETAR